MTTIAFKSTKFTILLLMYPGLFHYLPNSQHDWNFTAVNDGYTAQAHLDHMLQLPSGKMLGGSSSLGHQIYVRGHPNDFDEWAAITSEDAWNYNNLLPFFKISEKLDSKDMVYPGNDKFHSSSGPMEVTRVVNHISQKYLNIFKELGHVVLTDGNGKKTLGYYEPMFMYKDGIRQSTAHAYLTPILKGRSNLHVLKETEVTRIYVDHIVAKGVAAIKDGTLININASREVIISAGAIKTAQLLMLSGIGPKDHLRAHGIPVKNNLPVGKYYQDHVGVILVHKFNVTSPKSPIRNPHDLRDNMIIGNVVMNKHKGHPDYQTVNYIIPSDSDSLLTLCTIDNTFSNEVCDSLYERTKGYETMLTIIVLLHPKSRGHVALQSSVYTNPPMIISGAYSDESDMESMISYIDHFLQISKTSNFNNNGGQFVLPKLRGCEFYSGDAYWKCYALNMMTTRHHYAGTCSMRKVVDEDLRTIGITSLRVVDASVIPYLPSGHLQASVMAIAEKAADMILSDAKKTYDMTC